MKSLYLLIPNSIIFFSIALWVFFWAVKSGQYDDLDSDAERILFDQDEETEQQGTSQNGLEGDSEGLL